MFVILTRSDCFIFSFITFLVSRLSSIPSPIRAHPTRSLLQGILITKSLKFAADKLYSVVTMAKIMDLPTEIHAKIVYNIVSPFPQREVRALAPVSNYWKTIVLAALQKEHKIAGERYAEALAECMEGPSSQIKDPLARRARRIRQSQYARFQRERVQYLENLQRSIDENQLDTMTNMMGKAHLKDVELEVFSRR